MYSHYFKGSIGGIIVFTGVIGATFLQLYVLKHLPLKDCLPFKKGNNILELRKMPVGAIPDKYEISFVYEKMGRRKNLQVAICPTAAGNFPKENRNWYREQTISLQSLILPYPILQGVNVTDSIFGQPGDYYLFFIQNLDGGVSRWSAAFSDLAQKARKENRPVYVITSDPENVNNFLNIRNSYNIPVFTSDVTAIKTAARANPTLFVMKGPVVQDKYSWADIGKAIK